ncbi:MAG: GTP cyclohydrolase I FolE2 [Thaumarchaeota archaeon]|nr:GTP cyclohydrolase I FolE2 [Nitrososphaerota archaeon]
MTKETYRKKSGQSFNGDLPDVQMQKADPAIMAGIQNLSVVFKAARWTLPVRISVIASTTDHRGVHMSRFVGAIQKHLEGNYLEDSLRRICKEVSKTQPNCRVTAELSYPYRDQFLHTRVKVSENSKLAYSFRSLGITACPCSREIIGIGHMQRSALSLDIRSDVMLDFEEVALKLGECFSTTPTEFLRRLQEAEKILEAQANPKFVEDIVRECLKKFPDADKIEARSFESIHAHDAYAVWKKGSYE